MRNDAITIRALELSCDPDHPRVTLGLIHANAVTLTMAYATPLGNMTTETATLTRAELVELATNALDLAGRMPTTNGGN